MLSPCSTQSTAMAYPALAADGQPTDIPVAASHKGADARTYFLSLFPESFTSSSAASQLGFGCGCRTPTWTAGGPQGGGHRAAEGPGLGCSTAHHFLTPGWALLSLLGMAAPTASEDTCLPAVCGELEELGDFT